MKKYAFGIDVGGTTIKCGFFKESGELLDKWEIPTRTEEKGKHILDDIAETINKKINQSEIQIDDVIGVGVGVPGPVLDDGTVLGCVNLGWDVFNVADVLSEKTGLMVKAGNDANVAALGEMWQGGGRGSKNMVMVTLGTGVGGGIIINGKIVCGVNGAGGEIGHFHMNDEETDKCGCGKCGCLEQYASATGIVRMTRKALKDYTGETVLVDDESLSAKAIFDAAKTGDKLACEMNEKLGQMLGKALSYIASVTNPQTFVIGGGVSKAGEILTDSIQKYFKEYAFHAAENTRFALAELGNDAGIYGGVSLLM